MEKVTFIADISMNDFPPLDRLEKYFLSYDEDLWAEGGVGASFTIYGAENSNDEDRIDIHLNVIDASDLGMFLYYTKSGGGYSDKFYSLGNRELSGEVFIDSNDSEYSKVLFVDNTSAFDVVKYFIKNEGERLEDFNWITGKELGEMLGCN